jgi:hypothetical protein
MGERYIALLVVHAATYLLYELDLTTSALGLVEDANIYASCDGLVDVVQVGGGRHVQLVLLGQKPDAGNRASTRISVLSGGDCDASRRTS